MQLGIAEPQAGSRQAGRSFLAGGRQGVCCLSTFRGRMQRMPGSRQLMCLFFEAQLLFVAVAQTRYDREVLQQTLAASDSWHQLQAATRQTDELASELKFRPQAAMLSLEVIRMRLSAAQCNFAVRTAQWPNRLASPLWSHPRAIPDPVHSACTMYWAMISCWTL